jgi:pimeloyl-ACP methyl ester carboxylesterase
MPLSQIDLRACAPSMHFPTLVVHDPKDPVSAWARVVQTAARLPEPQLVPWSDVGHYRVLRDPHVISKVVSMIAC